MILKHKILTKIYAKEGHYEDAADIINSALENCAGNGDLYYIAAKIYQKLEKNETAKEYFTEAIKNYQTLSTSIYQIKKELSELK